MKKLFYAGLACCVLATHVFAAPSQAVVKEKERYIRCIALAESNPRGGYEEAKAWHEGGSAALHCSAIALVGLGHYAEAATILAALAHDPASGDAAMRAQLYDQAGNAWLLGEQPGNALPLLTAALALAPHQADMFADRARARAMHKDWPGADADLTMAIGIDSERADLYVFRSSARHAEGLRTQARADIDHALSIYPDYAEALVERGTLKLEGGDIAGARADWETAAKASPDSDAGHTAKQHLLEISTLHPVAH
jgi:tetratricopeptide (TPR) repeat protein